MTKEPIIVLISGYKGSGKDFLASKLSEALSYTGADTKTIAFADPMKDILAKTLGITIDEFNDYKNGPKRFTLNTDDSYSEHNLHTTDFRSVIQAFGKVMKVTFGAYLWAKELDQTIDDLNADIILVPDYRFDKEYEYLSNICKRDLIHVHVKGLNLDNDTDVSEQLPTHEPDFVFDNLSKNSDTYEFIANLVIKLNYKLAKGNK